MIRRLLPLGTLLAALTLQTTHEQLPLLVMLGQATLWTLLEVRHVIRTLDSPKQDYHHPF